MTFRLDDSGQLSLVGEKVKKLPYSNDEVEKIEKSLFSKLSENLRTNNTYSFAPTPLILATATTVTTGGSGVFWDAFMTYIFPWMLDIAKVFCAIKIAQGFYQEKRGGRDEGTGFGALVTYGKWYLVFWLIPWGVELIDQIGGKMLNDLRNGG